MIRPARILVMRGGAIGDFIVTLPALAALRARWPDSYIELAGYPHVARLALESRLINKIRPLHDGSLARYFAPDAPIRDEDRDYFASFDFIIQYLHDPQAILQDNLKRCGVKVIIQGTPLVDGIHAADHFLKPLESLAIYDASPLPRLVLDVPHSEPSETITGLAIHPGSGSRSKNWPLENFIEIARRAAMLRGFEVTFITGDADQAYIPGLDQALRGYHRIHNADLVRLARMLRRAKGFIGNDSGISHLAAATGIPALAIFGPSDPRCWAPRGVRTHYVRAPDQTMSSVSVDRAWAELVNLIDAPS